MAPENWWGQTYFMGIICPLIKIGLTNLPKYDRGSVFDPSFFTNSDVVTIKDETSKENS